MFEQENATEVIMASMVHIFTMILTLVNYPEGDNFSIKVHKMVCMAHFFFKTGIMRWSGFRAETCMRVSDDAMNFNQRSMVPGRPIEIAESMLDDILAKVQVSPAGAALATVSYTHLTLPTNREV